MLVSGQGGPPAEELHQCAHHGMVLLDRPVSLELVRSTHHYLLQKYHDPRVTSPWALCSISLHPQPQPGWETPIKSLPILMQGVILEELPVLTHPRALGTTGLVVCMEKGTSLAPSFPPFSLSCPSFIAPLASS